MIAGGCAGLPAREGAGAHNPAEFEFENGRLVLTEAGTSGARRCIACAGSDALAQFDAGGLALDASNAGAFATHSQGEPHAEARADRSETRQRDRQ